MKLTEKSVATVKWSGNPKAWWCDATPGFGVWVWNAKATPTFIVQAKRDGKSVRKTLGKVGAMTVTEARTQALQFRMAVKQGDDPRAEERAAKAAWTLEVAMAALLSHRLASAKPVTSKHVMNMQSIKWKHLPKHWHALTLDKITQRMIIDQHRVITTNGGPRVANLFLAMLSVVFNHAVRQGQAKRNPVDGVTRNKERQRGHKLTYDERQRLVPYLVGHHNVEAATATLLILRTGSRPGEVFKMKWAHVDLATGEWRKPDTKNGTDHLIVLDDRSIGMLARLPRRSEYVFPGEKDPTKPRSDGLNAFWKVTRKKCNIPHVRLYDLRHSAGSYLAEAGVDPLRIAAQLNHKSLQTTKRYVHFSPDQLREIAAANARVIDGAD